MKNRRSQAVLRLSATTTEAALGNGAIAVASGGAATSRLAGCFSSLAGNLTGTGFAAFEAASKGRIALAGSAEITAEAGAKTCGAVLDTVALETLAAATATGPGGLDAAADTGINGAAACITIPRG